MAAFIATSAVRQPWGRDGTAYLLRLSYSALAMRNACRCRIKGLCRSSCVLLDRYFSLELSVPIFFEQCGDSVTVHWNA